MDTPRMGIPEKLAARMGMPEQHAYLRARLSRPGGPSRRGLLRGGGLAAAAALGGAGSLGCTPDSVDRGERGPTLLPAPVRVDGAVVAPFGRHLAFGADPKTQMRVGWQVPFAVDRPYLRVGPRPWELTLHVGAEVRVLPTPSLYGKQPVIEQFYLHAALDGLHPGTTYYYAVGHDGFDPTAADRIGTVGSFTTAPASPDHRFVFTAFGDQGTGHNALANSQLLLGQNPSFHLHTGDLCYADDPGYGEKSDGFRPRVWDLFLAQTETVAARVPWMITTGNHDMEAWYSPNGYGGQLARWTLPETGPDAKNAPGVYSFTYGNVGVIALDANDVSYEIPANLGYTDGAQTRWLAGRLRELRGAANVDFVVVFFHHGAYSTSAHASDGGVRKEWVPLFEQHTVDLVINGHNHVYERTDPVRGGRPSRTLPVGGTTDPGRDGPVYVTAGGGGRTLDDFPVPDSYEGHEDPRDHVKTFQWTRSGTEETDTVEWSRVRYAGFSFLAVESRPGARPRLEVTALAQSGRRVDHFVVQRSRR